MRIVVDLHSHSGHAGGVGDVSLPSIAATMALKGIDVYGTGDCLHAGWLEELQRHLVEREPGLFALEGVESPLDRARFVLQSEIIITAPVPSGGRKGVHLVLLFPGYPSVRAVAQLLERWGTKLGIGRPFVKCESAAHVTELLDAVSRIDPRILPIPAHVLTPQGIYGSDHPVDRMADFFGDFAERIRVIETGLSADPEILALIPELDGRTFLSNSDCHSAALNRVGREFTALDVDVLSYEGIVESLLARKVRYTAEFPPTEGRYFLSGHRGGKQGHGADEFCYFSPDRTPADARCPICGKPLTIGVLERALALGALQGEARTLETIRPQQAFRRLVPLVEVIAVGLGVKSAGSPRVRRVFDTVLERVGTEADLWELEPGDLRATLTGLPEEVAQAVHSVKSGHFTFDPLGFDGSYGILTIRDPQPWLGHAVVHRKS